MDPPAAATPGGGSCERALPTRRIVRLTDRQLDAAVRDLFGVAAGTADYQTPGANREAFIEDAGALRVDAPVALQFQGRAADIAAAVSQKPEAWFPCPLTTATANACVTGWLQGFVRQAFRRPALPEEVADLGKLFETVAAGGSSSPGKAGASAVVEAVLQAPSFLYRTELGVEQNGMFALSAHELATQLSFWLLAAPPDDELRTAADSGALSSPDGIEAQVTRLLALPQAREQINQAMLRLLNISTVDQRMKDTKLFPHFADQAPSLLESARRTIADAVWSTGGGFASVYAGGSAEVNAKVAPLFGVKAPSGTAFLRMDLPVGERRGILTHPAVMAAHGTLTDTQVVQRGLLVRRTLLCGELAPPPPTLDTKTLVSGLSQRAASEARAHTAVCAGCHTQIDPLGLTFENYDAAGGYRTTADGAAVDASGALTGTDVDGPLANAVELADHLGRSQVAARCMSRNMLSLAVGNLRPVDSCEVAAAADAFDRGGRDFGPLLVAAARSDAFRFRSP